MNIHVFETYYWFTFANHKANKKMEKQFLNCRSAKSESDFNNDLLDVHECLQVLSSISQSFWLGIRLRYVAVAMTLPLQYVTKFAGGRTTVTQWPGFKRLLYNRKNLHFRIDQLVGWL